MSQFDSFVSAFKTWTTRQWSLSKMTFCYLSVFRNYVSFETRINSLNISLMSVKKFWDLQKCRQKMHELQDKDRQLKRILDKCESNLISSKVTSENEWAETSMDSLNMYPWSLLQSSSTTKPSYLRNQDWRLGQVFVPWRKWLKTFTEAPWTKVTMTINLDGS